MTTPGTRGPMLRGRDGRGSARLTGVLAVAVLVAVVAGGALLSGSGGSRPDADADGTSAPDGSASASGEPRSRPAAQAVGSESQRALAGTRALLRLERAVRTEREALFDRVYADGSHSEGDAIFTSLRRLPLSTYSLRYVSETARQGRTWTADVEVQWGLRDLDRRAATTEIEVTFARGAQDSPDARGAQVVAMNPSDDARAPVWLLGRLQVERVGPALVLSLQPPLTDGVAEQTARAVRGVHEVLEDWTGGLVVVMPRTTAQLEQMLAAEAGSYDTIAAVTASVDGGGGPSAPVRVLLNPSVFTGLGPVAGQVVLTHEATHAATGATFRDMPLWLVEGFGDYVALVDEPVPVEVAAGQILDRVRRDGPPRQLPSEDDFSAEAHGLGASYEAAWLACRLIAERHGQEGLLRLYREVARTGDVDAAFASVLGTDVATFTARWRDYLRELA